MDRYILAIDQGTTSSRAILFNSKGHLVAQAGQDFRQIYPQPGWVEHDAEEIWASVLHSIESVLRTAGVGPAGISAIGITNQRETTVVWERTTGKPIANAIVWQCRRTTEMCQKLKRKGLEPKFRKKTGLVLDPYFSGTKIKWILDNTPGAGARAQKGELAFGTIDTFLLSRLTGGQVHATDPSNASRTLLFNLKTLSWDGDLCKALGVPENMLPEVKPSIGEFGRTHGVPGLADGIPVAGIAGDQQAALFGQACFDVGEAKCTFGTGSFLLLNTGSKIAFSRSGLLTTVAWQWGKKTTYALEGSAFICGAAVQWLRDGLGMFPKSSEVEVLARTVDSSDGVEFVPALAGLGAPYWDPEARGIITGLTRGTTKAHLARATLEGMALQNSDLLVAMQKDLAKKLKTLKVDGGASANNLLMQMQADFLGVPCVRPKVVETTALGAALMAGLGAGLWPNLQALKSMWQQDRIFVPEYTARQRLARLVHWHRAVDRAKTMRS